MSHCTLPFKLYTQKWQDDVFAKTFRCGERMYNTIIRYALKQIKALEADTRYQKLRNEYVKLLKKKKLTRHDENRKMLISAYLNQIVLSYGLSEYGFHAYVVKMKNKSYKGIFDINTAQKIATQAWKSVSDYLYGDGKKIHFKKIGELESIEGKNNKSGIKFDKTTNCLNFNGMCIPIKIRKKDEYAIEMLKKRICYCRIKRKPFKNGYKYFLELVLDGDTVKIPELGKGETGIDQGTSTIAAVGDNDMLLSAHGITKDKSFEDYNKEIVKYARKTENSLRINNPQNYNSDGTIKKGVKLYWKRTKNYYKWLFRLKDAYRRKTAFVQQMHNRTANQILKLGDEFITEPMDWKVLQKRSTKGTEKSDKEITITNKQGETKTIQKCKKKKRYGKSLNNHSPAYLEKAIIYKLSLHNKKIKYVNIHTYKASQYNPGTDEYEKCGLSDRVKTVNGILIQRDLLSAYLLQKAKRGLKGIDTKSAKADLNKFIKMHEAYIPTLENTANMPKCMGLRELKKK